MVSAELLTRDTHMIVCLQLNDLNDLTIFAS